MAKKKTMKRPTPEPKQEVPMETIESIPSSLLVKYDPISDTISHKQQTDQDGRIILNEIYDPPVKVEMPKPREFEARACTSCQALRPHGTSYSRVYCTRGRIRYCKCHYCGHTWSQEGK